MDSAHNGNAFDGVATAKAAAAMINAFMAMWVVVLPDWVRLRLAAAGLGKDKVNELISGFCAVAVKHNLDQHINQRLRRINRKQLATGVNQFSALKLLGLGLELSGGSSHVSGW